METVSLTASLVSMNWILMKFFPDDQSAFRVYKVLSYALTHAGLMT